MDIPDRIITLAELRRGDGERGAPKLVACDGLVYDVSDCRRWAKEMHERLHFPGQDLTSELADAPHKTEVFNHPCVRLIGRLQTEG